ncbi:MAG: CHRD domain-containing protein [Bryobacterales bacterium]|nr:CHRD domain-containing protein [Bryobacterales bacterium]
MLKTFLLSLFCVATLAAQSAETIFYRTALLPSNEVPPIDINASGAATIRAHVVRDASGQIVSGTVDFLVSYSFPSSVELTGLHIHRGAAGVNGPVVINTGIGGANGNIVSSTGRGNIDRSAQVTPDAATALAALRDLVADPSGFYVNLHSTVNPGGVIRGQLQKPEIVTYMTLLSPRNEVPAITTTDASGVAFITAMRTYGADGKMDSAQVMFEVDYDLGGAKTMTGMHIHQSPAGVNGPVVINTGLANLPSTDSGRGSLLYPVEVDLSRQATVDVVNGLFDDPSGFYVNLHTTEFPAGVIRGQLRRTDNLTFQMNLLPSNEVPPLTLQASAPTVLKIHSLRNQAGDIMAAKVIFDVNTRFPGETNFTGLHIHNQVAGQNGPVTVNSNIVTPLASAIGFGNIYAPVMVTAATGLATLNSLVASPEKHYVNLHTSVNTGGAVRSQVRDQFTTAPAISSVLNSADYSVSTVAPGSWVSIFGVRFAHASTDYWAWEGAQLPAALNGVEVTVGGRAAPIYLVAPGQVDVQIPFEVEPGRQQVIVKNAAGSSAAFMANVERVAPAIWRMGENGGQIVRMSDVTFINSDNPGRATDVLLALTTGMGQTLPSLATGRIVPESTFAILGVTATLAGQPVPVVATLAYPGLPGQYVVAFAIPPGVPAGTHPLEFTLGGQRSNRVMLPVR